MKKENITFPLTATGLQKAARLFAGPEGNINETIILSALQGVMGELRADDPENPSAVRATVGDFAFFAGDSEGAGAGALLQTLRAPILCAVSGDSAQQAAWGDRFAAQYPSIRKTQRYAIKKEPDIFDRERLNEYVSLLPEGFRLTQIDSHWFSVCRQLSWANDFVACFSDAAEYAEKGLGFLILNQDGEPVAGASSYSAYKGGIEIEIDTRPDYRRRGLALTAAARLILACLERGLYPSWDAANPASAALSQKLGYHPDHPYAAWYLPDLDEDGGAAVQPGMNVGSGSK